MSRLRRGFLYDRDILVSVAYLAVILAASQRAFAWGREGHHIIAGSHDERFSRRGLFHFPP
jgi:hypothetical protein